MAYPNIVIPWLAQCHNANGIPKLAECVDLDQLLVFMQNDTPLVADHSDELSLVMWTDPNLYIFT